MSYNYLKERPRIFTESGVLDLLKIRDKCAFHIKESGAVTMGKAMSAVSGDSWFMMACVDYLVEIKELKEVTQPNSTWGQDRIFTSYRL